MRVALHSEIKPGSIEGYRATHAVVPDELMAAFDRVGIRSWTIFRSGHRLFHDVICDDWDAAIAALDVDPANVSWQEDIGRFVELYRDSDGEEGFSPLELVWDLEAQKHGG
ncbi:MULTISPECIES: L-rhamnose mutarotase [unclassified Pseudoclavibacter]|uniref:L-rhamnose mutarotase n=1 Tax=unclassified Pseudoclavibacter TaxID=2615177 RepID=UPI0015E46A84|nr:MULTISPECIES: L-rhamnose mutarotase [unclassified Pseudoclavibacter]MBF4548838.1 L-rhamnose mutarotase [Pseudoclavibacter sp. VKM Ac-2888]